MLGKRIVVGLSLAVSLACMSCTPRVAIDDQGGGPVVVDSGQRTDAGGFVGCGNGLVEPGEQCDLGLESNLGEQGGCNYDCTLSRLCATGAVWSPDLRRCVALDVESTVASDAGNADAGAPDAGVPDAGPQFPAILVGTLYETPGAMAPTALHPRLPISGATVLLRQKDQLPLISSFTTGADGRFRFEVPPGVDYETRYQMPSKYYSESGYRRLAMAPAPGSTTTMDRDFWLAGLHFIVRDGATNQHLPGVEAVIHGNGTTWGHKLTDAEGYVFLENSPVSGQLVFTKAGYQTINDQTTNTTHTVVGGWLMYPQ